MSPWRHIVSVFKQTLGKGKGQGLVLSIYTGSGGGATPMLYLHAYANMCFQKNKGDGHKIGCLAMKNSWKTPEKFFVFPIPFSWNLCYNVSLKK